MRRVPEFLPEVLAWHNWRNPPPMRGAIPSGINVIDFHTPPPTRMDLIVYTSPALISGLLMTEITSDRNWNDPNREQRVERFFFGYKCGGCHEVFLVHKDTRAMEHLDRDIGHDCDPSDLRRAVRNAREMGREKDEYIMEGFGNKWWPERFTNDAVYSREQVNAMLSRGDISLERADEMLNMKYETRDRKIDKLK